MKKEKVLVSTDIGSDIDDALSLLTMLNSGINVKGIYTVNGDVDSRSRIAKHLVNLSGKDIYVARGEAKPIRGEEYSNSGSEQWLVDESFVDNEAVEDNKGDEFIYLPHEKTGIISDGVSDLVKRLSEDKHTLFSLGPLTNIALALQRNPDVVKNIERLYVMGARLSGDLEHNIRYDIDAAKQVFASDVPITVVPGDVCSKQTMPVEVLEQLKSAPGKYVRHMARAFTALKLIPQFAGDIGSEIKYRLQTVGSPGQYLPTLEARKLMDNLIDSTFAAWQPEDYWKNYQTLLQNIRQLSHFPRMMKYIVENLPAKNIQVADVYVPYCFLNPDKLKTKRNTLDFDYTGRTLLRRGDKHEVVTDLDFNDFNSFLRENLK